MATGAQEGSSQAVQILLRGKCGGCRKISGTNQRMVHLFMDLNELTPFQRNSIMNRYVSITERLRTRTQLYAWIFHIGRTIVTVGSLIVPALLSIQYTGAGQASPETAAVQIYWITWIVSLLVTTCNGVLTLFKVDKKYYFNPIIIGFKKNKIITSTFEEGNCYCGEGIIELIGKLNPEFLLNSKLD